MRKVLFVLVGILLLVGCSQKQKSVPQDESNLEKVVADSSTVGPAYDSLIVCESRALVDSSYRKSEEFKNVHETYTSLYERMTEGMGKVDADLLQLKLSISAFNHNSEYFATHSSEMSNVVNQKRMMLYGQKIREIRQRLIQSKLSDTQQAHLDSLNTLIHF